MSLSWAKCIHVKSPVSISKDCLSTIPHRSSYWSDPLKSFQKNFKYVCNYSHACYLPRQIYPWFYQPWWREETTCPFYETLCTNPLLPRSQVQMFSEWPFTSHARDKLEKKDCYIKGRFYSKTTWAQKAVVKSPFFSGDNNNQNLSLSSCPSFCVEVSQ